MKERQILFSAPMVRAILEGRKTQTRRVVKPIPQMVTDKSIVTWDGDAAFLMRLLDQVGRSCPYGQPGDRLWVRETFFAYGRWEKRFSDEKGREELNFIDMTMECDRAYQYAADNPDVPLKRGRGPLPGWYRRPSIHMPRQASRILLEITAVRVERLQDISKGDCIAEGAPGGHGVIPGYTYSATPDEHYRHIWQTINGIDSWEANPWVWVIEFKRVTP